MAFCRKCGKELADGVQFCAECGTPVDAQADQANAQEAQTEKVAPEQVQVAAPTDDVTANKGIAWLSYLGFLLLVPLFARKNSKYCQFHVRQGVIILAVAVAYAIVSNILLAIIGAIFPGRYGFFTYVPSGVYVFFSFIFMLGNIFIAVVAIIGLVNAATGKEKKVPVLGGITLLDPLMDKIYASLNK